MSPSSRGRGLKYLNDVECGYLIPVALFTRAWIEIINGVSSFIEKIVALFTRAWIEMGVPLKI